MISEIKIGNFKAFGPAQTLPVRPITLVFGPNSAGKSSIIQSLLLARHIDETGDADAHQTTLGGAAVDLGGFDQYIHKHDATNDANRVFTFRLTFKRDEIPDKFHYFDDFETLTVEYTIGRERLDEKPMTTEEEFIAKVESPIRRAESSNAAKIQSITLRLDDSELIRLVLGHNERFHLDKVAFGSNSLIAQRGLWIYGGVLQEKASQRRKRAARLAATLGTQHLAEFAAPSGISVDQLIDPKTGKRSIEGFEKVLDAIALRTDNAETEAFKSTIVEKVAKSFFRVNGLALQIDYPGSDWDEFRGSGDSEAEDPFAYYCRFRGGERKDSVMKEAWSDALLFDLKCLIDAAVIEIRMSLGSMTYLGPLRWIPPRLIPDGEQFDASWGAGGGHAWQRLRRDPELLGRVNRFLQETLHLRYRLRCQYIAPELNAETIELCVERALKSSAASFTESSVSDPNTARDAEDPPPSVLAKASASDLAAALQSELRAQTSGKGLTELSLVDTDSNRAYSHRDVGTGISQLLPVLVNAAGGRNQLIAIEQPELHLHPALQAELGDVFIESALGENQNKFLIETHSEHLILRIMRRIRESNAGRQPAGSPELKPEHVAILYVQPTENGSVVRHLRLDERGRLIDPWPGGFFEESFNELF